MHTRRQRNRWGNESPLSLFFHNFKQGLQIFACNTNGPTMWRSIHQDPISFGVLYLRQLIVARLGFKSLQGECMLRFHTLA